MSADESQSERVLAGGVGNGGAVVRVGDTVRRPRGPGASVAQYLEQVGFERAPRYLGRDERDRDVFTFLEGDAPATPYPAWAAPDSVLREVGQLLREVHEAMSGFAPDGELPAELADPHGGPTWCHNDLCPENVVFRDGRVFGLIDFDTVAPGRTVWDLARTARMWVPMAVPGTSRSWVLAGDPWPRLAALLAGYGIGDEDAQAFAGVLLEATAQGQAWVRARVAAGEPAFVGMWEALGLAQRYDDDLDWIGAYAERIAGVARASVLRDSDRAG